MIGKKIIKFESLDSTSDYLNQLHNELDDGTVCLAFKQTKGRGRRENIWVSPKGNLYFSFIKRLCSMKVLMRFIKQLIDKK